MFLRSRRTALLPTVALAVLASAACGSEEEDRLSWPPTAGPEDRPSAAALAGSRFVRRSARDSAARSADRDTMALRSWTSAEGVFGLSFDALGERESARFTADPGDWTTPVATATPVAAAARPVRVTVPRSALRAVRRFSPT